MAHTKIKNSDHIITLKPKIKKRGKGIFYLLLSDKGTYKYGVTRNDVSYRLRWAQKITGENFTVIYTTIAKKPFKFESEYKWAIINSVTPLNNKTTGFFKLRDKGLKHSELIDIAERFSDEYLHKAL